MAVNQAWNGATYSIPQQGDPAPWGAKITVATQALMQGALPKSGGSFTLTADVNFGPNFGILSKFYTSVSASPATAGVLRLSSADLIEWRNAANTANLTLGVPSDVLTYSGSGLFTTATGSISLNLNTASTATTDLSDFRMMANDVVGRYSAYGTTHAVRPNQVWVSANTSSNLVFGTNNTERARISTTGNFGIGTNNPTALLHVESAGSTALNLISTSAVNTDIAELRVIGNNTNGYVSAYSSTHVTRANQVWLNAQTNANLILGTNDTERVRVTTGGNVGIGTNNPTFSSGGGLHIANATAGTLRLERTAATASKWDLAAGSGGFLAFFDAVGGAEAARFNSSRQFGIGTTNPTSLLHVESAATTNVLFKTTSTGSGDLTDVQFVSNDTTGRLIAYSSTHASRANQVWLSANTNSNLILSTNNTERGRVDTSGNLLVGTTSADPITANVNGTQLAAVNSRFSSDSTAVSINRRTSDGATMAFLRGGTQVGSISVTATNTAYNTSSDFRLKQDIAPAPSVSAVIDQLQVRSFKWKVNGEPTRAGFIAQELALVAPEAVTKGDDGAEIETAWAVDHSKLVPLLVRELQELRARVKQLEEGKTP